MENDEIFMKKARRCQLCGRLLFSEKALEIGYGCTCMKKAKKEQEEKQPIPGQMTIDDWVLDKDKKDENM